LIGALRTTCRGGGSNPSSNNILKLARKLPLNIDMDLLLDEWRLLQYEKGMV